MDRADLGFAVVDAEDARADGHRVEEAVLVPVHPPRSNNGRFGESVLDDLLALELGAVEGRLGRRGGVEVGDVNEARNARVVGDTGDPAGSRDVHVVEVKVPARRKRG